MASRLELQSKLEELLGSRNVYYQPPENFKINYPAIIYNKSDIDSTKADNLNYVNTTRYNVIIVDRKPDNPVISKILKLPLSSYDRHYVSDNLNHDSINLYF